MVDWGSYLANVYSTPQAPDVIVAVTKVFVDSGIRDPVSALGVADSDVTDKLGVDDVAAKVLVRRAIRAFDQSAKLQEVTAIAAASQPSSSQVPLLPAIAGDGNSALNVANTLSVFCGLLLTFTPCSTTRCFYR